MSEFEPPAWAMLLLVLTCVVAALAAIATPVRLSRWLPSMFVALGGLLGCVVEFDGLLGSGIHRLTGWAVTPYIDLSFRLDPLAGFFLMVICLPAIAVSVYGLGYLSAHDHGAPNSRRPVDAGLALFVASMSLVVLAADIVSFLLAWELMSLVSFFLVIGDGLKRDVRRSAFIYIVMTHIGTGFLILAFFTLFRHAGSLEFAMLRAAAESLPAWQRNAVFVLALIGFGTKAGLIPLHVWLPRAHPVAPSHISALMSGVMVKTAIYGLIRFVFEFAGPGPLWWGVTLLIVGLISAVLGILYTLTERDLKRILAYSTVEHVGIIVLGLGVATALQSKGYQTAAALAVVAALVHVLNHSIFKGLLFLGAGAIQTATGTRDLERLGGLVRRMPRTSALVLIGVVAIAALPPLNGFVGEWLLFQSLLQLGVLGGSAAQAGLAAVAAAGLALTGALALAGFVRFYGVSFLGQARSVAPDGAHEVGWPMQAGMGLLALGCVVLGVVPWLTFRLLEPVTRDLLATEVQPAIGLSGLREPTGSAASYAPVMVVVGLVLFGVLPWIIARMLTGPVGSRVSPTWVCGFRLEPRMQYSGTAFLQPIKLIFQVLIRPERSIRLERSASPYVVSAVGYDEGVHPVYERHLYQRLVGLLMATSHRIRLLQNGSIRAYLAYIFVTLVVVLILTR